MNSCPWERDLSRLAEKCVLYKWNKHIVTHNQRYRLHQKLGRGLTWHLARIINEPGHSKSENNAFEHVQNVRIHIILHMRQVSSGHLLSIETFYSIQWYTMIFFFFFFFIFAGSEGPNQTARMRRLIWAFAFRICPKTRFRMAQPILYNTNYTLKPMSNLYVECLIK